ncbi:hypothetical protein C7999DRAFT_30427 [Corynascus novoguineensis]|uniref:Uncharacterized protein n=1 Tax=Corynascus novoguineensis TaxID=1126955 RepID=A0AAN7HRH2_9PEZI|nr:hypothetical protein C7999DRAFT_30427 [Corynascus novoguineensis]
MIGILCMSIASSLAMTALLQIFGNQPNKKITSSSSSSTTDPDEYLDGAACREAHQRGFSRMWWNRASKSSPDA